MTKAFDDAVKPGRVAFKQPFNGAYEIIGCGRRVKIVLDDNCVHYRRFKATDRGAWKLICREEFENVHRGQHSRPQVGQRLIALRVIK